MTLRKFTDFLPQCRSLYIRKGMSRGTAPKDSEVAGEARGVGHKSFPGCHFTLRSELFSENQGSGPLDGSWASSGRVHLAPQGELKTPGVRVTSLTEAILHRVYEGRSPHLVLRGRHGGKAEAPWEGGSALCWRPLGLPLLCVCLQGTLLRTGQFSGRGRFSGPRRPSQTPRG